MEQEEIHEVCTELSAAIARLERGDNEIRVSPLAAAYLNSAREQLNSSDCESQNGTQQN
jgi:hypothetical protein